jgi:NADH-quinone oxidoreductase subunit N
MNPAIYQSITDTNQWLMLWPEITLGLLALLLLVLDLLLKHSKDIIIPRVAALGQVVVLIALLGQIAYQSADPSIDKIVDWSFFDGLITLTPMGQAACVFILLTSLSVSYLAQIYFKKQSLPRIEFYHLLLVVAAAMMLLVQSTQFVLFFVALETVTVGFYILVAYGRNSALSLEAGLKYLILGALSSAILLFGIVLLYGVAAAPGARPSGLLLTDAMNFVDIGRAIALHPNNPLAATGVALVLCGVAFKIGVVPFQIWVPDVYQGAPTPTTAFLAVGSKAVGFFILLNLVTGPFASPWLARDVLVPLLSTIAALSILFGNLAALGQRNVKRVMGLSGVAHAGYMLLGVVAAAQGVSWAAGAVLFYLFTYLLGSMAVFGVMVHVAGPRDEAQELEDYAQLGQRQPFLGGVLAIGLGSLAGIPPLAGFIGKLLLFYAAFEAHLYVLLGVSILGVVISIYYYFGWMREALFRQPTLVGMAPVETLTPPLAPTHWGRVILGLLAAATLFAGLYQGFFPESLK